MHYCRSWRGTWRLLLQFSFFLPFGRLVVADDAARRGTDKTVVHRMAGDTAHQRAFDAAFGIGRQR